MTPDDQTPPIDLQTRHSLRAIQRTRRTNPDLRHYALVDGAGYLTLTKRFNEPGDRVHWQWLLEGTELDEIKHAGPALLTFTDEDASSDQLLQWLIGRDQQSPLVSWLWSEQGFETVAAHLKSQLFTQLPDGRRALFRYYNPTVRQALEAVLTEKQQAELMTGILYWQTWRPLQQDYLTFTAPKKPEVCSA
jgi:hypothetical protein